MTKLAPSILSADFSKLAQEVAAVEKSHLLHIDIMDGHFVPNISYGATVMKSLLGKTSLPFDVHLMIEHPDRYLQDFVTKNTQYITVHQEACPHLHRTLHHIRDLGMKAGVAINPATPLHLLDCVLDQVDLVMVMSVNPGFGGQTFIASALDKVRTLQEIKERQNLSFVIELDGGITVENASAAVKAGADILVAGSSVFRAPNIPARIDEFLERLTT